METDRKRMSAAFFVLIFSLELETYTETLEADTNSDSTRKWYELN